MKIKERRQLAEMPFDRSFDGGFSLCHATGYEVRCEIAPGYPDEWWLEYEAQDGTMIYWR